MRSNFILPMHLGLDGGRQGNDRLLRSGSREMWVGSPDNESGPRELDFWDEEHEIYIHLTESEGLVAVDLNGGFLTALYDETGGRLVRVVFELGRFLEGSNESGGEQAFAAELVKEAVTRREQGISTVMTVDLENNDFYVLSNETGALQEVGRTAFEEVVGWDGDPVEMRVATLVAPYGGVTVEVGMNEESLAIDIEPDGGDGAYFSLGKSVDFFDLTYKLCPSMEVVTGILHKMFPTLKF